MVIQKIGIIIKHMGSTYELRDWIIIGCSSPPTSEEVGQIITCAKEQGTYYESTVVSDILNCRLIESVRISTICRN